MHCVQQNVLPAVRPRSQPPIYAIRLPRSHSSSSTSVTAVNSNVRSSGSVYIVPRPTANGVPPAAVAGSSVGSSRGSTIPAATQSAPVPIFASAKMVLIVEVTNVWFGAARCKPCRPVVISEQGIKLVFKDGDSSTWIYCVFFTCQFFL